MAYRNREEDKLERREEQRKNDAQGTGGAGRDAGDKPKRSWKEIDAKRDGARSSSSREPRRDKPESASYRNYKSKLDSLFDGNVKLPSSMTAQVAPSTTNWATAKNAAAPTAPPATAPVGATPKDRLKQATTPAEIEKAARECIAAGGLPTDTESLGKVLLLDDQDLILGGLEGLLDAMEKGRPRNAKAIVERLNTLVTALKDPHARDLAVGLKARLTT